jgi:hypothetical protein
MWQILHICLECSDFTPQMTLVVDTKYNEDRSVPLFWVFRWDKTHNTFVATPEILYEVKSREDKNIWRHFCRKRRIRIKATAWQFYTVKSRNARLAYRDGGKTMVDILSENCKKEYPKSVTELLRLEEKRFLQDVCYCINNIPIFIWNRYVRKVK